MNEQEWRVYHEPKAMLGFVNERLVGSERKMRLFSAACCRRVWHLITDQRSRQAIEIAEQYADGLATEDEREEAQRIAANVRQLGGTAANWTTAAIARTGAVMVVDATGQTAACPPGQEYDPVRWQDEWREQCNLIRDIFGPLPFRPIDLRPAWLTANVTAIAQAIYKERRFQNMPILADALEEAGCNDQSLLAHCRGPGPHVLGCWVLDVVLGKE